MSDNFKRSWNLTKVRYACNNVYGVYGRTTASYTQGGDLPFINDGIRRVLDDFPCFSRGWHTTTTVASQRAYDPPPMLEAEKIYDVRWKSGNTTNPHTPLSLMSMPEFDEAHSDWVWATTAGITTDIAYDPTNNKLETYLIPSTAAWTFEEWYRRRGSYFSTDNDADGILTTQDIQTADNAAPNGAYASSSVVTFTNPHPVYLTVDSSPSTAVTVTVTGTDQDGNSATEDISIATTATTAHGSTRFRTVTDISWTAAGNAINLTVGDYDQTASDSTFYCDVPDQYIQPLLAHAVAVIIAENDQAREDAAFFEQMYERNAATIGQGLQPIIGLPDSIHARRNRSRDTITL